MSDYTITLYPLNMVISPSLDFEDKEAVIKACTFKPNGYQYSPKYAAGKWDGNICLYQRKNQSAPVGLWKKVRDALKKRKNTVKIKYFKEVKPTGEIKVLPFDLYPFQVDAIKAAEKEKFGYIQAPVRAGKTAIMAGFINYTNNYPIWIITTGKDLVLQIKKDMEELTGLDVGYFSSGKLVKSDRVMVSSYQALARVKNTQKTSEKVKERNNEILKMMHEAKAVLLDECHLAFGNNIEQRLKSFDTVYYRIGLSASPKPDNKKLVEKLVAIGPLVYKIDFDHLIKIKRVAKPLVILYKLPMKWYANYVMEFSDIVDTNIVRNHPRNLFIKRLVLEMNKKGKSTLVMVNRIVHGEILNNLIEGSVFIHGEIDPEIRKTTYDMLQDKKIGCVISTVGKVGLNLPRLDVVINAEGLASSVATMQKMRSLTAHEGKSVGVVFDFIDRGKYLSDHSQERRNLYLQYGDDFIVEERSVKNNFFGAEVNKWLV